jgi:hypothetical protein
MQTTDASHITELVKMLKKKVVNDELFDKFLFVLRSTDQAFIANQLAEQLRSR